MRGVVRRLVGEPARPRAVAYDRHDLVPLTLEIPRGRDAERRRQPRARMAGPELVMLALAAPQEARQPAALAQRGEALVPAGENLPGIALVPHVPDDLVARGIETVAQRHRELHHAESCADVAAGVRHDLDQPQAHLIGERLELIGWQPLDVRGRTN